MFINSFICCLAYSMLIVSRRNNLCFPAYIFTGEQTLRILIFTYLTIAALRTYSELFSGIQVILWYESYERKLSYLSLNFSEYNLRTVAPSVIQRGSALSYYTSIIFIVVHYFRCISCKVFWNFTQLLYSGHSLS